MPLPSHLNQSAIEDLFSILEEVLDLADSDMRHNPSMDQISALSMIGLGILGQSESLGELQDGR
jgi:hypothetical protein